MRRSFREWLIRIIVLMVGLTVAHLGVTLFLLTELGSDPFNVLIQGLFRTLYSLTEWSILSHGRVHIAVSLLIILILLLTDRSYIKVPFRLFPFRSVSIIVSDLRHAFK